MTTCDNETATAVVPSCCTCISAGKRVVYTAWTEALKGHSIACCVPG